jgi:hypothetical protein
MNAQSLVDKFLRKHWMLVAVFEAEVAKLDAAGRSALVAEIAAQASTFNYMSGLTKEAMFDIARILTADEWESIVKVAPQVIEKLKDSSSVKSLKYTYKGK